MGAIAAIVLGITVVVIPVALGIYAAIYLLRIGKLKRTEIKSWLICWLVVGAYFALVRWLCMPIILRGALFYKTHSIQIGDFTVSINLDTMNQFIANCIGAEVGRTSFRYVRSGIVVNGCKTMFGSVVFPLIGLAGIIGPCAYFLTSLIKKRANSMKRGK